MPAFNAGTVVIGSGSRKLRVVHISDTHGNHHAYTNSIPDGDILIHSGDIDDIRSDEEYYSILQDFNTFLGNLPHRYKIYVSGNHEKYIARHTPEETQSILTNGIYLQDSMVDIEGVKIYGSPWTNCGSGFSMWSHSLHTAWERIPENTDILVTHMPPHNVLDLAWMNSPKKEILGAIQSGDCKHCGNHHPRYEHWGCQSLYDHVVNRVKPSCHLFGHVHDEPGFKVQEGVMFCNASMDLQRKPVVFDVKYDASSTNALPSSKTSKQPLVVMPHVTPATTPTLAPGLAQSLLTATAVHEAASKALQKNQQLSQWVYTDGYLRNQTAGLVLDIDLAKKQSGAKVHLWERLDRVRPQQQWQFVESPTPGAYYVMSKLTTDYVLERRRNNDAHNEGGGGAVGKLRMYPRVEGNRDQLWTLTAEGMLCTWSGDVLVFDGGRRRLTACAMA
eukprot:GFYU01000160.1.p1 GENE.GFYU01000160.1~~GFYU01000160.1.p1  ORF type:complete len:467 (-),score=72.30 GFYU01000160.1:516-1853(-)